jgi:hypothetical protein
LTRAERAIASRIEGAAPAALSLAKSIGLSLFIARSARVFMPSRRGAGNLRPPDELRKKLAPRGAPVLCRADVSVIVARHRTVVLTICGRLRPRARMSDVSKATDRKKPAA